jgi:malonate decarboxylase epsilon subunit
MRTVFLFPGQGSQHPRMLKDYSLTDPIVADIFSEVEQVLGEPVNKLDTKERLASTVYAQVCLLIAGVISARRLLSRGVKADYVAGHSVGAFAAAVISGVLSFADALKLVWDRGTLMEQAYPKGYGMLAVTGFQLPRLQQIVNQHNQHHSIVYLSNINAADQQVIAGEILSLNALAGILESAGIRKAQLLNLSVPSHCPLMQGVSTALKDRIAGLKLNESLIPYCSNYSGRVLTKAETIGDDLWKSIAATVKWFDATTLIYESGVRIFIEVSPSGVLSKIAASSFPEARILSLDSGSLDTISWLWHNSEAAYR